MMFTDRLFLARVSPAHLSAAMSGGLSFFMLITFFVGLLGYVNALSAQYLGAGRADRCGLAGSQALLVSILAYPALLALAPVVEWLLRNAGHAAAQIPLETAYFRILAVGAIFFLFRVSLSSFFAGIGRTRIVMVSSLVAAAVNIPANYAFIFGRFGAPELGIRGAAFGTVLGGLAGVAVLFCGYLAPATRRRYGTTLRLRRDRETAGKLLKFGSPSGLEMLLNVGAFNLFVQLFHSYGEIAAAAMTITFNWDIVAFIPMTGVGIATMSLVGRHMGAKRPDLASQAAFSGLRIAYAYMAVLVVLFVGIPDVLVGIFRPEDPVLASRIVPQARIMLRCAALYLLADATVIVFGGALRGAGDTRWTMWASVSLHWLMAVTMVVFIKILDVPPMTAWTAFIAFVLAMGATFFARFRHGAWRRLQVVGDETGQSTLLPVDNITVAEYHVQIKDAEAAGPPTQSPPSPRDTPSP